MASKIDTQVLIDGKVYTVSGYEGEEYLQSVGSYINGKITEFKRNEQFLRQSLDVQRTLVELNMADDYYKVKKQSDELQKQVDQKDMQLYDLKHELIAMKIGLEAADREIENMQKEILEYQKEIIRLEAELRKELKK